MITQFNDLPILETTKDALIKLGFTEPTPIQEKAIPIMIEGLDLIGQAQTGTGKTFAFAIPMIEKTNTNLKETQGLILTPTRELAIQVYKEIIKLVEFYPALKVALIVGGESYDKQFKELSRNPHIVVATPGRIIDHIDRKRIDLSNLKTLTLDEADEMLKMGFQEEIEKILIETPRTRQTVLFSATMPAFIKKIATNYQKSPVLIKIESKSLTVDKIKQSYFMIKETDKIDLLKRLIDYKNPKTAIIFVNTKTGVDRIVEDLIKNNYNALALHGDLKQSQRNHVMTLFRNKQINLLVATDVAARGLDVDDVEIIFNYDFPQQNEIYIHRIGRTGRAGKYGLAYTFITPSKRRNIVLLSSYIKKEIPKEEIPSIDKIYAKQVKEFKKTLKKNLKIEYPNYLDKIEDILTTPEDKDKLINYLLNEVIPKKATYKEIFDIPERSSRKTTSSNNKKIQTTTRKNRNGNYVNYYIPLGKKDGLTPKLLVQLLEKGFNIYSRNVGDIKPYNDRTVFELKKDIVNRVNLGKYTKYKGKKITLKII